MPSHEERSLSSFPFARLIPGGLAVKRLAQFLLLMGVPLCAEVGLSDLAYPGDPVKGISVPPPTIVQVWSGSRTFSACWNLDIAPNKTLIIGQWGTPLKKNSQGSYFCGFAGLEDPAGAEMLALIQAAKRDGRRLNIAVDEKTVSNLGLGWKILAVFMF